jgi:hypothetical protein
MNIIGFHPIKAWKGFCKLPVKALEPPSCLSGMSAWPFFPGLMGDDWGSEDELDMLVAERLEAAYEAVMGGPSEASGSSDEEEDEDEAEAAVFDLAGSDNDGEPDEEEAPVAAPALTTAPISRPVVRGAPQRVPARASDAGGDESDGFEEVAPVRPSRKRPRAEPEADADAAVAA